MRGQPRGEAIAVGGGRVVAVGSHSEVTGLAGRSTRVVDLSGRAIVPGVQDAHVHPLGGGLARVRCALYDLAGQPAYEQAIADYSAAHPSVEWILGGGWSLDDFPGGTPHRFVLDRLVPGRPAYLTNRDGHGAWVSSRALALAGIGRKTPDPPDGRIERDPDGEPAGTLHEGAMDLVARIVPQPTGADREAALLEAQRHLHSLGITGWQDAHGSPEVVAAYRALAEKGELTARVVVALWWDRHRGSEQIPDLLELRVEGRGPRLRSTSVKIMQDGIPENFTAGMIEPYLGGRGSGLSFVEPRELREHVTALDREGFQVHVHAIGDRAVREALDAFEAARDAGGRSGARHHIAHIQIVHPSDVERFARLGVVANCQPYWACLDRQMRDLVIPFIGEERMAWQYPFGAILRAGASLAGGSDWPVTTANPWKEIQVAVTRKPDGDPDRETFLPAERISLDDALRAFTSGSAFVNHLDDVTGTLERGKLADFAVLDRDPFEIDPLQLGELRVLATFVEGAPVYAEPRFGL